MDKRFIIGIDLREGKMDVQWGEQDKLEPPKEGLEPRSVPITPSLDERAVLQEKMTTLVPLYWSS